MIIILIRELNQPMATIVEFTITLKPSVIMSLITNGVLTSRSFSLIIVSQFYFGHKQCVRVTFSASFSA